MLTILPGIIVKISITRTNSSSIETYLDQSEDLHLESNVIENLGEGAQIKF